jgi:hypothetical protein
VKTGLLGNYVSTIELLDVSEMEQIAEESFAGRV